MSKAIQAHAAKSGAIIVLALVALSSIAFGYGQGLLSIYDAVARLAFVLALPVRWLYKLLFGLTIQLPGASIEANDRKWRVIYAVLSLVTYLIVIGSIFK